MLELDNTNRETFCTCPRKYQYSRIMQLKSMRGSSALRFGTVWHAIMEGYYNTIVAEGWDHIKAMSVGLEMGKEAWNQATQQLEFWEDYRTFDNAAKLLLEYIDHYKDDKDNVKIIDTEKVFRLKMIPDASDEEKSLFFNLPVDIYLTGQLDLRFELNHSPWNMEHKTTSRYLSEQAKSLNRSAQFLGYTYASKELLDFKTQGCLVSFVHLSSRKNKEGEYGKLTTDFARIPQIYTERDLMSWRLHFFSVCEQILSCMKREYFPMNFDSCYRFGTCAYAGLCEQNCNDLKELNLEGYEIRPWDVLAGKENKLIEG